MTLSITTGRPTLPTSRPPGRVAAGARPAFSSQQTLRIVLGLFWLLDGALQLQSFMFTKGFANGIVAPVAAGQPFFVAGPVEWNARFIGTHPEVLNTPDHE